MDAPGAATSGTQSSFMKCNICDQVPTNPVRTTCGHTYCWACLYNWLERQVLIHGQIESCPRCGPFEHRDGNNIPMYGAGEVSESSAAQDGQPAERQPIPPRPTSPNLFSNVDNDEADSSDLAYKVFSEECKRQLQGGYGIFSGEVDQADRDKLTACLQDIIHAEAEMTPINDHLLRMGHDEDVLENINKLSQLLEMTYSWLHLWLLCYIKTPS